MTGWRSGTLHLLVEDNQSANQATKPKEVRRLAAPLLTWRSGTLHLLVIDNKSANQATKPKEVRRLAAPERKAK